jgi:hypothetical protein
MSTSIRSFGLATFGFGIAMVLVPAVASAQSVGAAAGVKQSSNGTPPGGTTRTLQIGTSIVSNERIRTNGSGSLQVMFVDTTALTIGPNSDLVIDRFVYSPNTGVGEFSASLATGSLRFIGGQISHDTGATISTPQVVVGVRGGAVLINLNAVCQSSACAQVVCLGGRCDVRSLSDMRTFALRPGQGVQIAGPGMTRQFEASSVSLNNIGQGSADVTTAQNGQSSPPDFGNSGFASASADPTSQGTVARTIQEQSPEPIPPVPPPPPP